MRVISSVEFGGVEYQAIWAARSWIDKSSGSAAIVLAVRTGDGTNEAIIPRNAKLAGVESSLRALRAIGLGDSQLSQLFNHKGNPWPTTPKGNCCLVGRLRRSAARTARAGRAGYWPVGC